jgi:hypothetical protein
MSVLRSVEACGDDVANGMTVVPAHEFTYSLPVSTALLIY